MNRRVKWLMGLLVLVLIFLGILLVQHRDEVDWVAFGKFVGLVVTLSLLLRIVNIFRYRRLEELIDEEEVETAFLKANTLFRLNVFPNVKDQMICLKLSLLALQREDRDHFFRFINKLEHPRLLFHKYFWRAILHYREQQTDRLERNVHSFAQLKPVMVGEALYTTYEIILQTLVTSDERGNDVFEGDDGQMKKQLISLHPVSLTILEDTFPLCHHKS